MFSERPESLPAFVVFILYILIYGVPRGTLLQSALPRNPTNLSKSSKYFFIIIYLFYLFRFVRFTRLSAHQHVCAAGHSFPVGYAEKSSKSFQIFQIFFFIYIYLFDLFRFVRFLCREAHSPSVGCTEKFHKSSQIFQIFFYHYLFVRFVPICKIYSPDGSSTRLSAGHSISVL